jgi:hypothetical protein
MKRHHATVKSAIVAAQSLAAVGALVLTVAAPWKWT